MFSCGSIEPVSAELHAHEGKVNPLHSSWVDGAGHPRVEGINKSLVLLRGVWPRMGWVWCREGMEEGIIFVESRDRQIE